MFRGVATSADALSTLLSYDLSSLGHLGTAINSEAVLLAMIFAAQASE